MQKIGIKFYSLYATILFIAPLVLRLVMLLLNLSGAYNILFYCVFAIQFVLVIIDVSKLKQDANAFCIDSSFKMNVLAYLASFAFFADFISCVLQIVQTAAGEIDFVAINFVPICIRCVFAFCSSLYFIIVGLSFAGNSYDFRQFKVFHIVIILWSLSQFLSELSQIIRFTYDINAVLKYCAIIFGACFFYRFVCEIENKASAKKSTLFFARAYSYCGIIYFLDTIMSFASSAITINYYNLIFAATVMFLSIFAMFFERNITIHNQLISD